VLASKLAEEGKLDEAADRYRHIVELQPEFAEAYGNFGALLERQGRLDEAAASYTRAIKLKPDFAVACYNLGSVREKQGRLGEAATCYRQAVRLAPDLADAHLNLAVLLEKQGELGEAAACCRRVIELRPDHAAAHNNLAAVLAKEGNLNEAAACCRRALALQPHFAEAHNNLAGILRDQHQLDEAATCCRRAIELQPEFAAAHNNLAGILRDQLRFDEAAACCRRALELSPHFAEAQNNFGLVLRDLHRLEESRFCSRRAIELASDWAEAHYNLALTLLTMGRLAEGWPEYEWRWRRQVRFEPAIAAPRWRGEALAGRTILLRTEQGLGDTLQFVRYAQLVKQQGGTVIVEVQPSLTRLVASCPGVDGVVTVGAPLPPCDVYVHLLSLPGIFGTSLPTIPARVPYLSLDEASLAEWKRELAGEPGFKIGLAWQGNPTHPDDRRRSIPLAHFASLASVPGIRFYSLQWGAGREQLTAAAGLPITDLGERLGDFCQTAAIVRNLNLVISCDSSAAHLAGALGIPVWVALASSPDWRWMLQRSDSPWYPTMRLFRQSVPGDWPSVVQEMEAELRRTT
jgi:tetratricopeptide (TPR) repeat protein